MAHFYLLIFSGIIFCLSYSSVHAHDAGLYLRATADPYNVEVHYLAPFQRETPAYMSFMLEDVHERKRVRFTDVDITIVKDERVVYKTDLMKKQTNAPGVIVSFPGAGEYHMHLVFNSGDKKLASASFDFSVTETTAHGTILGLHMNKELGIGLFVGGIVMSAFFVRLHFREEEAEVRESSDLLVHTSIRS